MRRVQQLGIVLFLMGLFTFSSTVFVGHFSPNKAQLTTLMAEKGITSKVFESIAIEALTNRSFKNINELKTSLSVVVERTNTIHRAASKKKGATKAERKEAYGYIIYSNPKDLAFVLGKASAKGLVAENSLLFFWLSFGLGIFGALLFIVPQVITEGPKGIKNNGIYKQNSTNRGFIAMIFFSIP